MIRSNEVTINFIKYCVFALFSSQLYAAPQFDDSEDDFFGDIPTVLTVSRLEQPKSEAPSSVTIIDRDMIKASGARQIADIFRLVPGFVVGNVTGNTPAVTYHGLGATYNRQMQVIIDGRSVYIPSFGGVPWSNLPLILEDIERVEVTRGPNAASYGANSFLAVINIITREAAQESGTHLAVTHSNDHKSVNDGYFSVSKQLSDHDFRFSAKTLKDNGFRPFASEPNFDSKDISKINFKSNFLIKQNSQWAFQFGKNNASLATGLGTVDDIFRQGKSINQYQSLRYEHSSHNSSSSIQLFHTENELKDAYEIALGTVSFDRYSERTEIEFEKTIDLSSQLRTVFGGSYRKDTVDSLFLLGADQKQSINVSRLFAHAEYKFNSNKILNIGGMLENSDITDAELSPRIAFVQHLTPSHTLRLAYSKAFRNPILFESNGRKAFKLNVTPLLLEKLKPNPNIKPEEINSFEIALYSQISSALQTDIKIYQYTLSNQIIDINTTDLDLLGDPIKQFKNSNETTHVKGIELSLSYKPNARFFIKSGLNLIDTNSDILDVEHSFPDQTFFVLSQYELNLRHSVSGAYYFVHDIGWYEYSSNELGDTKTLDLRYTYNFTINHNTPFILEIIGQNLLNDYADFLEDNIQETSLFFKLSSNF